MVWSDFGRTRFSQRGHQNDISTSIKDQKGEIMVSLHCPRSEDHSVESVLQVGAPSTEPGRSPRWNQRGTSEEPVMARVAEESDEDKLWLR